jgi:hypothetical protein
MSVRTTKVKGAKSVTLKQTINCGDKNDKNKYVYHRYGPSNQQATIAAFERVLDMKQRELDLERQTCAVRVAEYEHLLKIKTVPRNNRGKTPPSQETQEDNAQGPIRGGRPFENRNSQINQEARDTRRQGRPNRGTNNSQAKAVSLPKRIPKKSEKGLQYNNERAASKQKRS